MKAYKKIILVVLIALVPISCAHLEQIAVGVNKGIDLAHKLIVLQQYAQLTKTEVDKTIKVFKPGSTATNKNTIPKGQENKLVVSKGQTKNLKWEPIAHFDNQLFPSVIVSMATYKQPVVGSFANSITSNALGFSYAGNKSFVPVRYEIESTDNKYFNKSSGEFVYQQAGQTEIFMPEIPWKFDALTKQYTNKPIKIYYRLFDEKGNKAEKVVTVTMRSIDDCIFYYKDYDMRFMFAAYVQEQHPEIDKILREGLNTKMVNRWIGYQGSTADVDKQVAAIWRVLHERGFVYSSITSNAGDKGDVVSQAVRTFESSLKTNQANCVDGTIVFASILKRIGISPVLVMVPGHCFLGYYYYIDAKKTKVGIKFLETTMISETGSLYKAKTNDAKNKEFLNLFKKAQASGIETYQYYQKSNQVELIDVTKERKRIDPLPYYP